MLRLQVTSVDEGFDVTTINTALGMSVMKPSSWRAAAAAEIIWMADC